MKLLRSALAVAVLAALSTPALAADAATEQEIAELRAQVQALMSRIDQLEQRVDLPVAAPAAPVEPVVVTAPTVETRGGLKVTSADEAFSASLGGRIHFDAYAFDEDIASATDTTEFRRARLTLAGSAYGWDYKMEQDFAAGTNLEGLRDLWIGTGVGPGRLTIGHFKPYRAMEELTSSNDILMMERPFVSASGLFNGRQFQQGVGYLVSRPSHTFGASVFNLRGATGPRNEGFGASARATWAPINDDTRTLHLGGWVSHENANEGSDDLLARVNYAGRRGPSLPIALLPGESGGTVEAAALEAAGSFGSLFFQSEFARARFEQPLGFDEDVDTFYVQGAWVIGGHRPYKPATGVFAAPKVSAGGLWELTARYDRIDNDDLPAVEASTWLLGVNYYLNPSLRLMLNYAQGDNELTGDDTGQVALRTQFVF